MGILLQQQIPSHVFHTSTPTLNIVNILPFFNLFLNFLHFFSHLFPLSIDKFDSHQTPSLLHKNQFLFFFPSSCYLMSQPLIVFLLFCITALLTPSTKNKDYVLSSHILKVTVMFFGFFNCCYSCW